ncbi:Fe-S oxidoreductase [Parafrankia soli]|nr:Fe-S oxidoreductase [Parafrankia soli]
MPGPPAQRDGGGAIDCRTTQMIPAQNCATRPVGLAGFGSTLRAVAPALDHRHAIAGSPEPADGWIDATDLRSPAGLDAALGVIRDHHQASAEVAVSYLTAWYAATIVGPAVTAFVLTRRVPDLDPAGISVRCREGGWFDATAFRTRRMTIMHSDPVLTAPVPARIASELITQAGGPVTEQVFPASAYDRYPDSVGPPDSASYPDSVGYPEGITADDPIEVVEAVADVETLRARLVSQIVGHLEPVLADLRPRARLGHAALWGAVAAQCGRAFLLTERVSGDPHAGRLEADAFFASASPPLRARPTWQQFVHRGRPYTGMRRGSCCLAHRVTAEFCTACPFVAAEERENRLREWIDTQGPGGLAV